MVCRDDFCLVGDFHLGLQPFPRQPCARCGFACHGELDQPLLATANPPILRNTAFAICCRITSVRRSRHSHIRGFRSVRELTS